jgi:hypothetical protein
VDQNHSGFGQGDEAEGCLLMTKRLVA